MPKLNIRKVGDGSRCYAVWLDHWPVFLDGLEGLPHVGDRFEIRGELWRVVEIYDRIICEREPSKLPGDSEVAGLLRIVWNYGQAIAAAFGDLPRKCGCGENERRLVPHPPNVTFTAE
jgi:hypothetical protein